MVLLVLKTLFTKSSQLDQTSNLLTVSSGKNLFFYFYIGLSSFKDLREVLSARDNLSTTMEIGVTEKNSLTNSLITCCEYFDQK